MKKRKRWREKKKKMTRMRMMMGRQLDFHSAGAAPETIEGITRTM